MVRVLEVTINCDFLLQHGWVTWKVTIRCRALLLSGHALRTLSRISVM